MSQIKEKNSSRQERVYEDSLQEKLKNVNAVIDNMEFIRWLEEETN